MIAAFHAPLHSWIASNSAAFLDHVVISTLLLAVLLLASSSRFLRPRTRHMLLVLGLVKFLVPASLSGEFVRLIAARPVAVPSFSATAVFRGVAGVPERSEWLCVAAALWMAAALLVLVRAIVTQLAWRRVLRTASPPSRREVETMYGLVLQSRLREIPRLARTSSDLPTTVGFLHPVILLPASSTERLDDDELRAVLAHELGHVARRHNLFATAETLVRALFWFDPLVWIASGRVRIEAEKDCDEQVLGAVSNLESYLTGILKSSYGFIAPQPAGVSCMSTTRLKERMDHLMKHIETKRRSVPHRLAVTLGIAAVVLTTAFVSASGARNTSAEQDGITSPKVVTRVEPVYPESARANKVQGIVILSALIDDKGNVLDATVSKGIEGDDGKALEDAAVAAVRQWKFDPARKNGKAVTTRFTLTIRFLLSDGPKK